MSSPSSSLHSSASIYNRYALHFYDLVVLVFSNTFAWRCPTKSVLLPFFVQHLQGVHTHLDIGVGSGYYPAHSTTHFIKNGTKLTLMDMNLSTLHVSLARIRAAGLKGKVELIAHDVFIPAPEGIRNAPFEAVSLFYLLHCLPGKISDKTSRICTQLIPLMQPDGTLYGATILGKGVQHNWIGRLLMRLWNSKGVFDNYEDDLEGLAAALKEHFEEVKVVVEGKVALFVAKRPLKHSVSL
ncbi:S-adenosyl-L-methionine dependent methyltransferase [Irpex rosettiformis]|uniref:S-adenosyl-L-methionine dependent methyltransferase n=1 Tax=Irpex rosettiformis TaxID=378272 RepID=A0ACB8UDF3_9APHY|nr:S-adenosyl-L-methionine dependent methyltransferase [Irpex rosettiformis]